ncbi:putative hemolysin [Sinosporangium album]|uniref:Putative hemolysin n=1 Tax=Sinosporangium album TaxID=504805 RepID=A0A1G7W7X1_9ACTN|nr:hemolysin family protein [Sinosporangium album]SDG68028.1 putative hemolysin [Sinosporangium album]
MNSVLVNSAIVLLFILIGGFFAAAEMALVSLRESQVRNLAARGRGGARVARLARDPNRFLSAVQIGVTVATMLSAAFGAETLAAHLIPTLVSWGLPQGLAPAASLVLVTLAISYVSLVFGELVPKRLARQRAEGLSLFVAPLLDGMATLSRPVIWALSKSTDVVVKLLGGNPSADREEMTTEELRDMVVGHHELTEDERHLIGEVFAAGKRQLREVMLPRTEVEFMAADTALAEAAVLAVAMPHSRYPVFRDSYDEIIGFVHVKDLLDPVLTGRIEPISELVPIRPVKLVPASKRVLTTLSEMRDEGHHLAIVVDEYGGTAGIVTLEDLVEELIGDIRDEYDLDGGRSVRLPAGEVEIEGLVNLDEFAAKCGIRLPDGPYETLGGFMMAALGHLPTLGERVEIPGFELAVTAMDGRRVDRVRVKRRTPSPPPDSSLLPPAQVGESASLSAPSSEADPRSATGQSTGVRPTASGPEANGRGPGGAESHPPPGA